MKSIFAHTLALLAFLELTVAPGARASIDGATARAVQFARTLEDVGYDFEGVASKPLALGQSAVVEVTLYHGVTYAFLAGGCEDAYDVDLAIYNSAWVLQKYDLTAEPVAVVEGVTPSRTGTYFVRVTMSQSTSEGAHYVLMMGSR